MAWEIALALGMIIIPFILIFLAMKLDKEHFPLKLFFIVIALWFILSALSIVTQIASASGANVSSFSGTLDAIYAAFIYIIIFVIAYFVIYFIAKTFKAALEFSKQKKILKTDSERV